MNLLIKNVESELMKTLKFTSKLPRYSVMCIFVTHDDFGSESVATTMVCSGSMTALMAKATVLTAAN